jgi:hypothetical protein
MSPTPLKDQRSIGFVLVIQKLICYFRIMGKKRIGRPPLPKGQRQAAVVTVRMSKAERKLIGAAAKSSGVKLSNWIRLALIRAAGAGRIEERKAGESNSDAATNSAP